MSTLGRIPERRAAPRWAPPFGLMKWLSFAHSAVYLGLLACWIGGVDGGLKTALGWGHGWGWIIMCVLTVLALRGRVLPLWLAVCVAVVGAVGPFVGSAGFVVEQRRRERATS
ncbi:hypothetical protein SK069_10205 [Patulibacter brassicae]|uniref:DUF3817 domain-containing protein n=1 Tax=Patulibacter brassicae TaxID=1705717 RepID=A0ABU4VKG7_9ACTN|nr:hypothetical protein [Patulibacter brassicae]MDX8151965.1 hypothetical protein [Patulibacter brassicae]